MSSFFSEPVLYDMHVHTPLCGHARGEPEEYAAAAQQRGLAGIVFTCHNPMGDGFARAAGMELSEFDRYVEMVERARTAWAGEIDVRLGLECDYIPEFEGWLEKLLGMAEFHHVLGSVHPHLKYYRERYVTGDFANLQRTYFDHVAMAAETGLFDTISHPDLVKDIAPEQWDPASIRDTVSRCLDRVAATDTAMELNTSGLEKSPPEMNPGVMMLQEMYVRDIPVVLGSDAHDPYRIGASFEEALNTLSGVGYTHVHVVLDRKRKALPISRVRSSLRR